MRLPPFSSPSRLIEEKLPLRICTSSVWLKSTRANKPAFSAVNVVPMVASCVSNWLKLKLDAPSACRVPRRPAKALPPPRCAGPQNHQQKPMPNPSSQHRPRHKWQAVGIHAAIRCRWRIINKWIMRLGFDLADDPIFQRFHAPEIGTKLQHIAGLKHFQDAAAVQTLRTRALPSFAPA